MAGALKEVRNRITSVQSTQQITKAMKMVSAAKLRRAQDAIVHMRPYANKLQKMMQNIVAAVDNSNDDYTLSLAEVRPVVHVMVVVITSDRGLSGSYNANIIKLAKNVIDHKYHRQYKSGNVTVMPIGKKAYEYFKKNNYKVDDSYWTLLHHADFDHVQQAANHIMDAFNAKTYDVVELVYSQFINAASQKFVDERYLPIPKAESKTGEKIDFIFEPNKYKLLNEVTPQILSTQLYKAVLDATASEHGARMTAMDKATENANELLKALKLSYNRARQAAITTELTEIVSGAAALQG